MDLTTKLYKTKQLNAMQNNLGQKYKK